MYETDCGSQVQLHRTSTCRCAVDLSRLFVSAEPSSGIGMKIKVEMSLHRPLRHPRMGCDGVLRKPLSRACAWATTSHPAITLYSYGLTACEPARGRQDLGAALVLMLFVTCSPAYCVPPLAPGGCALCSGMCVYRRKAGCRLKTAVRAPSPHQPSG